MIDEASNTPKPADARGAVAEAEALRKLGRTAEAGEALAEALKRNPRYAPAYLVLAELHRSRKDGAAALEALKTAHAIDRGDRFIAAALAEQFRLGGEFDQAERYYREIVRDHPSFLKGHYGLGQTLRARGLHPESVVHFQAAVDVDPGAPRLQQALAEALRDAGRHEAAAEIYRTHLQRDPQDAAAHRGLAEVHRVRGDRAEALPSFRAAALHAPDSVSHGLALSNVLRELGQYDEAIAIASEVAARNPALAQPLIRLSQALKARGEPQRALEALARAVKAEPGDLGAKCSLAGELTQAWRLDEADALYAQVLRAKAGFPTALMGRGVVARMRGERSQAKLWFEAAVQSKPSATPLAELALEAAQQGQTAKAIELLRDGLKQWPADRRLLEQLGRIARMRGDHPLAVEAFSQIVEADPHNAGAQIELARDLLQGGKAQEGLAALESAFRLDPAHPAALDELAARLQASDRMDDALRVRRRAAHSGRARPSLWLAIAEAEAKLGDLDGALARLNEAASSFGRSPDIVVARARLLTDAGLFEQAAEELDAGAKVFPYVIRIYRQRIALATARGDWAQARHLLDHPPPCSASEAAQSWRQEAELASSQFAFDQALDFMRQAIKAEPAGASHYLYAGRMALLAFKTEDSLRLLTEFASRGRAVAAFRGHGSKPSQSFVGQILTDWRLDPEALSQTRAALNEPAPTRPRALARVVADFPDHTGAALALMAELRRQNLLASPNDRPTPTRPPIPRRIAQFWDTEALAPDLKQLCASWGAHNPEFAYQRFSLASARDFLSRRFGRSVSDAFGRARESAAKADIFRLAWLYAEGGFYADADDRCVAGLEGLGLTGEMILYQENIGSIGNNFMGSIPENPLLLEALKKAVEAVNHGSRDILWLSTGPGLMTRIVAQWFARDLEAALSDAQTPLILDHRSLTRAVRIHCTASYKHRGKHWGRRAYGGTRSRFDAKLDELCTLAGVDLLSAE